MQDRIRQVDEISCNARPDHTFGSFSTDWHVCAMSGLPLPLIATAERMSRLGGFVPQPDSRHRSK